MESLIHNYLLYWFGETKDGFFNAAEIIQEIALVFHLPLGEAFEHYGKWAELVGLLLDYRYRF